MAEKTVLVADDDETVRSLLRAVLEKEGYRVAEAGCGEEVLAAVADAVPHLLVLDLIMPGMDGYTVLARLQGDARHRELPIIVLSGEPGDVHEELVRQFGALGFLQKPFKVPEVMEAVDAVLGRGRA